MSDQSILLHLSDTDLERIDQWRREIEPVSTRNEAAEQLISIALDDVEMKGTGLVSHEVIEEMADAISTALELGLRASRNGQSDVAKTAHRIHETLQGIGILLGIKREQLSSVSERLDAIREAPDKKN